MAGLMRDIGVRPEIEAFDTGHLWLVNNWHQKLIERSGYGSCVWAFPGVHLMT